MRINLFSSCAGLLVAAIYSFLNGWSPTLPVIVLVKLSYFIIGVQMMSLLRQMMAGRSVYRIWLNHSAARICLCACRSVAIMRSNLQSHQRRKSDETKRQRATSRGFLSS